MLRIPLRQSRDPADCCHRPIMSFPPSLFLVPPASSRCVHVVQQDHGGTRLEKWGGGLRGLGKARCFSPGPRYGVFPRA